MSSAPSVGSFDAKRLVASLPDDPGVYRMLDGVGQVLYVGKAKCLKKRVASYFREGNLSPRIRLMVQLVASVEVTATRSEAEALILENNLIKRLTPRFNILFRDDKSYPYIELSVEPAARIAFHRGPLAEGAQYFGPFPNVQAVRDSIHLLQRVFRLRTCEPSVFQNRSRPCLLHQIHRCSAPCVGLIAPGDYAEDVRLAELFLRGHPGAVIERITESMQRAAEKLDFEKAAALRNQVRALQQVLHKQFAEIPGDANVDVVAVQFAHGALCVNHAMIRGGRHLGDKTHFPQNAQECLPAEALAAFVEQHYAAHAAPAQVLINLPIPPERDVILSALIQRGVALSLAHNERERAWIDMAERNARIALAAHAQSTNGTAGRIEQLQQVLELGDAPRRIECFDVSHTMGEGTVASCVVFSDGAMRKSEYRRYNIDGIRPGDDYAAMSQVLLRRYEKVAAGEGVCPDLILVDGGIGQVGRASEVLAELGLGRIPAIGVAKGVDRKVGAEALVLPDRDEPLMLGADHPALHLVQLIRDEAHRFAVAGHRARRARRSGRSRLEDIPGIGPAKRKRLLAHFGGLQGVLAATVEDLARTEGISRKLAEAIYNLLH